MFSYKGQICSPTWEHEVKWKSRKCMFVYIIYMWPVTWKRATNGPWGILSQLQTLNLTTIPYGKLVTDAAWFLCFLAFDVMRKWISYVRWLLGLEEDCSSMKRHKWGLCFSCSRVMIWIRIGLRSWVRGILMHILIPMWMFSSMSMPSLFARLIVIHTTLYRWGFILHCLYFHCLPHSILSVWMSLWLIVFLVNDHLIQKVHCWTFETKFLCLLSSHPPNNTKRTMFTQLPEVIQSACLTDTHSTFTP